MDRFETFRRRSSSGRGFHAGRYWVIGVVAALGVLATVGFTGPLPTVHPMARDHALTSSGATAASTRSDPVSVSGPLAITSFVATPSTDVRGNTVYLNVSVTGGTLPYAYNYSGLPHFCLTQDTPTLSCSPAETRTFSIRVTVVDAAGATANRSTNLTVVSGFAGPPVIQSITLVPTTVATGHLFTITVAATSNSSIAYFFADLPQGCTSFNASQLTCVPLVPGTFTIHVLLQDGFGAVSEGVATEVVTGNSLVTATASTPSGPSPLTELVVVVIIVAVAGGVGVVVLRSMRRPGNGGNPGPPSEPR